MSLTRHLFGKLALASLIAASPFFLPSPAKAGVFVSINIAPPVLPVYVQPPCPTPGFLWTPGYWAYGPMGYYWVPGVWIAPPRVGLLWTPGYWGFSGGLYAWHAGYWGPHVGFYGGVNYGFGFTGVGFVGGAWTGGMFRYNTAVTNVNTTIIHNTYLDRTVINSTNITRASFNGPGGVRAVPNAQERAYMHEQHIQPTPNQFAHERAASQDRNQLASFNHGHPGVSSMDRVNGRAFNQQARIANGISSSQLRPGQAAHLEGREAAINREVHADRAANGGRLTPQERVQVNRQQNNASRAINADKREEHQQRENHAAHEERREGGRGGR